MRSRMFPEPAPSGMCAESNPWPSSSTRTARMPWSRRPRGRTDAARPACFATFWIASEQEKYAAASASSVLRGAVPSRLTSIDARLRLRAQRFYQDAGRGEGRRVDPVADLAHRVERRLGASSQRRQRAGERGRRVAIFLGKPERDDQRHELVLNAVVQVTRWWLASRPQLLR
jgi:hypothetical protein